MPNEFASTQNDSGLLKDYYPSEQSNVKKSDLQKSLKKRLKKLSETKIGLIKEDERD